MFLEVTKRRNPGLIQTAATLHQQGSIPPNTYIIDLDVVAANTKALSECARENDFSLYFMTKQLGRIPQLANWVSEHGIKKAVAVEWNEAKQLHDSGIGIGNAGHLVQPGKHQWKALLEMEPEVITVFSVARAVQVSNVAVNLGIVQPILLRVVNDGDLVYPAQEGGFELATLPLALRDLFALPGIRVVGITSFPALQLGPNQKMMYSPNIKTLQRAKTLLNEHGIDVNQVNAPSATSCATISMLKKAGVTHGEPGHALTGTTPIHAVRDDLEEKPGIVYVTEVSHDNHVIGGGFYERGNIQAALVGSNPDKLRTVKVKTQPLGYIDYYGSLEEDGQLRPGDTAVYAFRTQIFVTRADVALVRGIQNGTPEIVHFERRL